MSVIDHKKQAQSRVYAQYRNKPKAMEWIGINGELGNEIEKAYQDILSSYNIDNTNTEGLNVLGRIVVINRSFEAETDTQPYQLGSYQLGSAQLRPVSGVSDQSLNNDVYKLLIKAKIAKNNSDATLDGIVKAVGFMVKTTEIQIEDFESMSFSIIFGDLTDLERFVLSTFNIIPKPQGVRFLGYIELAAVTQLGRNQLGSSQLAYRFGA